MTSTARTVRKLNFLGRTYIMWQEAVIVEIVAKKDYIVIKLNEVEMPIGLEFEGAIIRAFNIAKQLKDGEEETVCSIGG